MPILDSAKDKLATMRSFIPKVNQYILSEIVFEMVSENLDEFMGARELSGFIKRATRDSIEQVQSFTKKKLTQSQKKYIRSLVIQQLIDLSIFGAYDNFI